MEYKEHKSYKTVYRRPSTGESTVITVMVFHNKGSLQRIFTNMDQSIVRLGWRRWSTYPRPHCSTTC